MIRSRGRDAAMPASQHRQLGPQVRERQELPRLFEELNRLEDRLQRSFEQLSLRREVAVEPAGTRRESGPLLDRGDRRALVAALAEELDRSVDDPLAS